MTQRAREIAIRVALGSSRLGILRWIGVRVAAITLVGLGLGVVAAWASAGVLRTLLFDVQPFDPGVLAAVAAALTLAAMLATWLAARRAARTEPARLLSS
jgi:ABC-type antimicrobial peptide transport system permease subunit